MVAPDGRVVISDTSNRQLKVFHDGEVSLLAGSGSPGADDGFGDEATFSGLPGVTVDECGFAYVADSFSHHIRRVSPDGAVDTIAGTGTSGFTSGEGPALEADLNGPGGIAWDAQGERLYFFSTGNNVIRVMTPVQ